MFRLLLPNSKKTFKKTKTISIDFVVLLQIFDDNHESRVHIISFDLLDFHSRNIEGVCELIS